MRRGILASFPPRPWNPTAGFPLTGLAPAPALLGDFILLLFRIGFTYYIGKKAPMQRQNALHTPFFHASAGFLQGFQRGIK
jgi:hypothetical protein